MDEDLRKAIEEVSGVVLTIGLSGIQRATVNITTNGNNTLANPKDLSSIEQAYVLLSDSRAFFDREVDNRIFKLGKMMERAFLNADLNFDTDPPRSPNKELASGAADVVIADPMLKTKKIAKGKKSA